MTKIYVEVRPKVTDGDLTPRPTLPEQLSNRIDEIGDSLRDIAVQLSRRLSEFAQSSQKDWQLGEVSLKFSLDLEAEAGVVIARTSASAGFEASLTWKKASSDGA